MTNPNPAIPAQAATPGNGAAVVTPPSGSTPPATNNGAGGTNQEGTVTISAKEYRDLQRAKARTLGFGRRYQKPTPVPNIDPNDPNASALATAEAGRIEAERKTMQLEVKGKVRDLLEDERFKNIPLSTKKIILEAPHMLSEAETLDEAMYDIEDKLIEISQSDNIPVTIKTDNNNPAPQTPNTPPARETPPVVTPGSPAPVDAGALEDTSGLRGQARSTAALRNAFKKKGMAGMKQDS